MWGLTEVASAEGELELRVGAGPAVGGGWVVMPPSQWPGLVLKGGDPALGAGFRFRLHVERGAPAPAAETSQLPRVIVVGRV